MPYPTEHAARLTDPAKYESFSRKNNQGGSGIDFIYGIAQNGDTEIQAIRFNADTFTPEQSKAWLTEHEYAPIKFEPSMGEQFQKSNPIISLRVTDVFSVNGGYSYECGYALTDHKRGAEGNFHYVDSPIESQTEFYKRGAVIDVEISGAEPVKLDSGIYAVRILNPILKGVNPSKSVSDSAKSIIKLAESTGRLLASDYQLDELSEAGIIFKRNKRSLSVEYTGDKASVNYEFPFFKDDSKQIVYGVVYEPWDGTNEDTQGDYATAEEIEKAANKFIKYLVKSGSNGINLMHEDSLSDSQAYVCQSSILLNDLYIGKQLIRKGSWVVVCHIEDPELWKMVKTGGVTCFSMEGTGRSADFAKRDEAGKSINKRCLLDMDIKAIALVDRGANRKKFFLTKSETKGNTMEKKDLIALVKNAGLNPEQAEAVASAAGFAPEVAAEVKAEAAPAAPVAKDESAKAAKALTDAVEVLKATCNDLKKEAPAAPAAPAEGTKDAKWYIDNPDAEIPEDMMEAVAELMASAM